MLKAWNFTKINSAKHALIIIQGKVSKQYSQERLQVDTFESYFNVRFMFGQFRQLFGVWCCNFCYLFILPLFVVLCVRLKICRSNFYFFYEAKCTRPKNWARHRGFVHPIGISAQFVPDCMCYFSSGIPERLFFGIFCQDQC